MAEKTISEMLLNMKANVGDMTLGIARVINTFDELGLTVEKNQKGLGTLGVAFGNLLAKIGYNVLQAPVRAFAALNRGVQQFIQFTKGATMQAARIEVQWRTLALTAGNAGKKIEDMSKHVQNLRAYGIKTSEALESITQFLATGLPVENISELARRAQDMAVVIGKDSTEAFQRFNWFLQTGNSMWIRTMGITKTATQMLKEYADAQGLVVKALTDRQRKEALVQGLMKATIGYEGAYEEALKDPYKRWTSLPRLISNVTEVLGHVFVPMMGTVVDIFSDALEKAESLFRITKKGAYALFREAAGLEAGAELDVEQKAAAIDEYFGNWTEGFYKLRALVGVFADWFKRIWESLVGEAGGYGEGIMDGIVEGIIRGTEVLADVLVQITTMIADFLAPGSPPKKGPLKTLDKWGIALMRDYMRGWTKIDFSIFNQIAGTIRAAIEAAFTVAGRGGKGAEKLPLMEALLEARKLAGQVTTEMRRGLGGVAAMLSGVLGPLFGDMMRYLALVNQFRAATEVLAEARRRLAAAEEWVAAAQKKVEAAQKRVAQLQEWVAEQSKKIAEIRRRHAKLERQWAEIPERFVRGRKRQLQLELDAAEEEERRRQEAVEAAQRAVAAAQAEVRAREESVKAARAQVQAAQAYAAAVQQAMQLQQQQLQELTKIMAEQAKIAKAKADAATVDEEAVDRIKNQAESLDELSEKWKTMYEARLLPAFEAIEGSFGRIKELALGIWDTFDTWLESVGGIKGIIETIGTTLGEWKEKLDAISTWWGEQPEWVQKIFKGVAIALGISWVTGGLGNLTGGLMSALMTAGLSMGPLGWALVISSTILATLVITNKEELQQWFDPTLEGKPAQGLIVAIQKMFEWSPLNWITGGAWGEWTNKNIIYPITETLLAGEQSMSDAATRSIADPFLEALSLASEEAVGESIIPDMVTSIVEWFVKLSDDTTMLFDEMTLRWRDNLDLVTEGVDRLIAKLNILAAGLEGLPPLPKDLTRFREGQLQVVTINLQGAVFGGDISEADIRGWLYDAIADLL